MTDRDADAKAEPADPLYSRGYLAWMLFLLFLVEAVGFMERVIIQTIGQSIKEDLRLSDLQLGLLGGFSFAILYSSLGLPLARLVERYSRVTILSASVAFFSVMAALCGTAPGYVHLILYRIGVGVGEAGLQPSVVSLLGDHYPANRRSAALTVAMLGVPFGSLLGSIGGGFLAEHVSWRVAFVVVAAPGIVIALLVWLTLREPPRGYSDGASAAKSKEPPPPMKAVFRLLWSKRSFRHAIAGVAFASMGIGAMGAFMHPFFVRHYQLGVTDAALMFGLSSFVAVTAGMAISGFGVGWLSRWNAKWYALVPAIGTLCAAPFYVFALRAPTPMGAVLMITAGSLCSISYQTPTISLLQNMVQARMRATAAFTFFFTGALIGQGLGPPLFGLVSDLMAARDFGLGDYAALCPGGRSLPGATADLQSACAGSSAAGIRDGAIAIGLFFLMASLQFFLASRSVTRDIEQPSSAA